MSINDSRSGGVRLDLFANPEFDRGASRLTEFVWLVVSGLLVDSWLPGSGWRCALLRCFGARIGIGVVIKPRVRVKFPWRLDVGDHTWIGEGVWIDNLALVRLGSHVCVSQGAYLCTGSHDWSAPGFDLITRPIVAADGAWIGARATIGPGVTVGDGAVLTLSSIATRDLEPWGVYAGSPLKRTGRRRIRTFDGHVACPNPGAIDEHENPQMARMDSAA